MFYNDGFLHAILDEEGPVGLETKSAVADHGHENKIESNNHHDASVSVSSATQNTNNPLGNSNEKLSRRQQQKVKRKLKKQQAKELDRKRRHLELEDEVNLTKDKQPSSSSLKTTSHNAVAPPLRLHQFVSTVFRSELNVAENGTGLFVKNAPKVSAHYAILKGVVQLNGKVCKLGRTVLAYGDVVSLQLEQDEASREEECGLIAWQGSVKVAKRLEGERDRGERQGRMMPMTQQPEASIQTSDTLSDNAMIKHYREVLKKSWIPEVQESAIITPLPLTLRVLKPSARLAKELVSLGFSPVNEDEDFSLMLSCLNNDGNATKLQLSTSIIKELLRDTWIARGDKKCLKKEDGTSENNLGIFLSEARVSGEIVQQELTSMLPVSIISAHLKKQKNLSRENTNLRFLDLCSAPGSKTVQLMSALHRVMMTPEDGGEVIDFTLVANELNPQRANWMRQRLHQQSDSKVLSNLIITCADGRAYAKMKQSSFDYILCDVPCSGDGTIRKSPKILDKWSLRNAGVNKMIQKELLKVGLGLLKPSDRNCKVVGGFLVYSTCSLNPMENEEVISEVMDELNGNRDSACRFELVDLSGEPSTSSSSDNNTGHNGNYLPVLPAKSHGGFFVAAIRKVTVKRDGYQVATSSTEREEDSTNIHKKLITRHVQSVVDETTTTISYSISPCTQRCHAELINKMGKSIIISSGIAVLFESSTHGRHILQQGCASLISSKQHRELVGYIQFSHAELIEYQAKASSAYRKMLLPIDRLHTTSLDAGTPLIIQVVVSSSSSEQYSNSFLLPARIAPAVNDNNTAEATKSDSVLVKILARPQILRRSLSIFIK